MYGSGSNKGMDRVPTLRHIALSFFQSRVAHVRTRLLLKGEDTDKEDHQDEGAGREEGSVERQGSAHFTSQPQ